MALILWFAIVQHTAWALMLSLSAAPAGATAIASVYRFLPQRAGLAAVLFAVSGLSLLGLVRQWPSYVFIPQWLILVLSAAGAMAVALQGHYADGEPRPIPFIVADQFPSVILAGLYLLAIFQRIDDDRS